MFKQQTTYFRLIGLFFITLSALACQNSEQTPVTAIDRQQVVERHHPGTTSLDPQSPFTLGNGRFAFSADATGLQSFAERYFAEGIPLETKARWAWHSRANPDNYTLDDAMQAYSAYKREVNFPTNMDAAAGQWLRKNPHDLPLARIGFAIDGKPLSKTPDRIQQTLELWQGRLLSNFELEGETVAVTTLVSPGEDKLVVKAQSALLANRQLAVDFRFPRGYDLSVKNTPDILFTNAKEHTSEIIEGGEQHVVFARRVDNATHYALLNWSGAAQVEKIAAHHYRLQSANNSEQLQFSVHFSQTQPATTPLNFAEELANTRTFWQNFWQSGAFVDFSASSNPAAPELERRILLSRYLMATQSRASVPAQETGLTNSSWYGKHHTEMVWWHTAHWILWNQPEEAKRVLRWFNEKLPSAQALAKSRGLKGARWAKMVGPDNRESPGGNPLIIWNQPQPIHLAEMLYQHAADKTILEEFSQLVNESAEGLSSMLVWQESEQHYSLTAPIWIAQEIYTPSETENPSFELAYWRAGLETAIRWRERLQQPIPEHWQKQLKQLAALPVKDNKLVAIESIPDTFDNKASRQDHPSMLAVYGLLNDSTVEKQIVSNTLQAVLKTWDWEKKIWGWDYPMIAMSAARLEKPQVAVDILLADLVHNKYLNNGHVPQAGSGLRVYLPANGALLSAVAMMIGGWQGAPDRHAPGFPDDGSWVIKAEGFSPLL